VRCRGGAWPASAQQPRLDSNRHQRLARCLAASLESLKSAYSAVRLRMPQTQAITHKSVLDHPHTPLAELYKFMLDNHTVDDSCAPDFR
jgi:hypothetical protein